MKSSLLLLLSALWCFTGCVQNGSKDKSDSSTLTADSAQSIAHDAWIYSFPMFTNYRTMYLYAMDKKYPDYIGGFNQFRNYSKSFTSSDTAVVTPNNDTPYSWAILNLSDEPVIIEVPEIKDKRYYALQLIDLYTFNFGYIGSRTTGTGAGRYMITGPGQHVEKPAGVDSIIPSETYLVTLLGRTELKTTPNDMENVRKIQQGFKIIKLHEYTGQPAPSAKKFDLPLPVYNPAVIGSYSFIGLLNNLLQYTGPAPEEEETRKRFARIGIEPGKQFDSTAFSADILAAINTGVRSAEKELQEGTDTITNATDLFGTREMLHGNYFKRALGAAAGLFGNTKEEAVYIGTRSDKAGKFLAGKNDYIIRFPKGQTPPNKYFWSITLYELPSRFLVKNPINRYSIGDRTSSLQTDPNGDLTLYLQHQPPSKDKEPNWLPTPEGAFYYLIRIYGPEPAILTGEWKAPQPELVK